MKKFLQYLYKHLATVISIFVTVVSAVVLNCIPTVKITLVENFVIAEIIALNLTFLLDLMRNTDKTSNEIEDLKEILPTSRIKTYDSVDKAAEKLIDMVHSGKHDVDLVLFDTKIRTSDPKKVNKMTRFVKICSERKNIKLRLAFVPTEDSVCQRIDSILESEANKNESYYAYQESKMTFASFLILDHSLISIRTPFKNGSKSLYCIVKDDNLCTLYSSWFSVLWEESSIVNIDTLLDFIKKFEKIIPDKKIKEYKLKVEDLSNG